MVTVVYKHQVIMKLHKVADEIGYSVLIALCNIITTNPNIGSQPTIGTLSYGTQKRNPCKSSDSVLISILVIGQCTHELCVTVWLCVKLH